MCAWIVPPAEGLCEPVIAPEIVADGIGAVEYNNGQIRLYLYAEQMELGGRTEVPSKVITVKIVGPLSNVPAAIGQLARCLILRGPSIVPGPDARPPFRPHVVP